MHTLTIPTSCVISSNNSFDSSRHFASSSPFTWGISKLNCSICFAQLPEDFLKKFPERLQAGSAYKYIKLLYEKDPDLRFPKSLSDLWRELKDEGKRIWIGSKQGRIFPDLRLKDERREPVGQEKWMNLKQFSFQNSATNFLNVWHLEDAENQIPWTIIEFHPSAQKQMYQYYNLLQMNYLHFPPPARSKPPSFDRGSCVPPFSFNTNTIEMLPHEILQFSVSNNQNCVCYLQNESAKICMEILLSNSKGSAKLPNQSAAGDALILRLIHSHKCQDEISIRIKDSRNELTKSLNELQYKTNSTPTPTSAPIPTRINGDHNGFTFGSSITLLPTSHSQPWFTKSSHHQQQPCSLSLSSSAPQQLPSLPKPLLKPRPIAQSTPAFSTPSLDEPECLDKHPQINFESSMLHKNLCCIAHLELYIRAKRRGQWQLTNVAPQRIGKMRKCSMYFFKLTQPIRITVESSNADAIKLSSWGRSSSEGVEYLCHTITPNSSSAYAFYIIPTKLRVNATITVSVQFLASNNNEKMILHQWDFIVAGHKFESSRAGLVQSEQNNNSKRYYLFFPDRQRVYSSKYEADLDLIDSLFLLKGGKDSRVEMNQDSYPRFVSTVNSDSPSKHFSPTELDEFLEDNSSPNDEDEESYDTGSASE